MVAAVALAAIRSLCLAAEPQGAESTAPRSGLGDWLPGVSRRIEGSLGIDAQAQERLLATLLVLLGLWLLRLLLLRLAARRTEDVRVRYLWRKGTLYAAIVVALLVLVPMWVTGIQDATTFLGLLSAGLALAFKDVLVGLIGWVYIVVQKPFRVGDRIELGEFAGDVIDSGPLMFTILEIGKWVHADQSTGRMAQVPNSLIFTRPLVNYTKGFRFIWNEVHVLVTFESNWCLAKELLLEIATRRAASTVEEAAREIRSASRQFMIVYSKLNPTVYTSVEDCGVRLSVRYLCSVQNRRDSAQAIWEDILAKFAERSDIDFAYPTQRFYRADQEGKATRGKGPGAAPSEASAPPASSEQPAESGGSVVAAP